MTKLGKPVRRETATYDCGRAITVTLYPRHMDLRMLGLRKTYSLTYDSALWCAIKQEMAKLAREKAEAKKAAKVKR